jgi:hypothetical protein
MLDNNQKETLIDNIRHGSGIGMSLNIQKKINDTKTGMNDLTVYITAKKIAEQAKTIEDGYRLFIQSKQQEFAPVPSEIKTTFSSRYELNKYLKKYGYKWQKTYADHDEYEEGEPSVWMLGHSKTNRWVTVDQALKEIEDQLKINKNQGAQAPTNKRGF